MYLLTVLRRKPNPCIISLYIAYVYYIFIVLPRVSILSDFDDRTVRYPNNQILTNVPRRAAMAAMKEAYDQLSSRAPMLTTKTIEMNTPFTHLSCYL